MCSIDEAWAGQNFAGKRVVSQGDFHKSYMSLPENAFMRNNSESFLDVVNGMSHNKVGKCELV